MQPTLKVILSEITSNENIRLSEFNDESDECSKMLEIADEAKNAMISGTIDYMENNGKEINIDNVNNISIISISIIIIIIHTYIVIIIFI